jgi:hypothetical protein
MLTDIFSDRYSRNRIWDGDYQSSDSRFFVQAYKMISEQLFPASSGNAHGISAGERAWKEIHDRISMELGQHDLAPNIMRLGMTSGGRVSAQQICEAFLTEVPQWDDDYDCHMKDRISFVELAFRIKGQEVEEIADRVSSLRSKPGEAPDTSTWPKEFRGLGDILGMKNAEIQADREANLTALRILFRNSVDELNERMRKAGYKLHFHNGFIQISDDQRIAQEVESPFWGAVSDPDWKNVDLDMKEAIDQRDSGGKDPALYAAKALESTIKIISDKRGLTTGNEKGAANYLDNLGSKRGSNILLQWEKEALALFFSKVRNQLGHGPGGEPMPTLTPQQTDWAIGFCMTSIISLIRRL